MSFPATDTVKPGGEIAASRPSIVKASRWMMAGGVSSRVVQLLNNFLLAHLLGPAGLGLVSFSNSTAVTISGLVGLGLGDAVFRFSAEYFRRDPARAAQLATMIAVLRVAAASVAGVLLWFGGSWLNQRLFPVDTSAMVVGLCLALAWVNSLSGFLTSLVPGLQLFRDAALFELQLNVSTLVFAAALGWWLGPTGAMMGYLASNLLFTGTVLWRLARLQPPCWSWPVRFARADLRMVAAFAIPVWLACFVAGPMFTLSLSFVGRLPDGAAQLGLFNVANVLKALVLAVPAMLAGAANPAIVQEGGATGDARQYDRLMERVITATGFIAVPVLVFATMFGDVALAIYGRRFESAFPVFLPIAAGAALLALSGPLQVAYQARGRAVSNLVIGSINCVLMLAGAYLLVPRFEVEGLAWAILVAQSVYFVIHTEFGIRVGVLHRGLRRRLYLGAAITFAVLLLACFAPDYVRWAAALPCAFLAAALLFAIEPDLAVWVMSFVPPGARPGVARLFRLLAFVRPSKSASTLPPDGPNH